MADKLEFWRPLARRMGLRLRYAPRQKPRWWLDALEVGYDGQGLIVVGRTLWAPWVAHELGHWLAATPENRRRTNWGFDGGFAGQSEENAASVYTVGLWRMARPAETPVAAVQRALNTHDPWPVVTRATVEALAQADITRCKMLGLPEGRR